MVARVAREEGGQTDAKLSTGFSGCAAVVRAVATGGRLTPRRVGPFLNRFDYTPRPFCLKSLG